MKLTPTMRALNPNAFPLPPSAIAASERAAAKSEREIQKEIISFLELREITPIHQRMDRRATGIKGQPDIIFSLMVLGRPLPVAFECKTAAGKCSSAQVAMLTALKKDGWFVRVVRSDKEAIDAIKFLLGECPAYREDAAAK